MVIQSLFRITSHFQMVEVDDVSTSFNKVSNQVLILEGEPPTEDALKQLLSKNPIGTVAVVDTFPLDALQPFDKIIGCEHDLTVIKITEEFGANALICLPEDFLTFYIGQSLDYAPKIFSVKVITMSDRAHRGIYPDLSGPKVIELITGFFEQHHKRCHISSTILPDSAEELSRLLANAKQNKTDILITTGGTGLGKRDITVETVKPYLDKEIPGIMEMIRVKYGQTNSNALLTRAVAGIMGDTLVYTVPGNVNAVNEYLTEIFVTLNHLLYMMHGIDNH